MEKTLIYAGCGGGYDIFGCLPLYYETQSQCNIILVNLSFTSTTYLDALVLQNNAKKICEGGYEVVPHINYTSDNEMYYCPEEELAVQLNHSVYAMCNYDTVNDINNFYSALLQNYKTIDSFYLVDGGCDVLLSGKETELGTPVEDMMHFKSIMSISKIKHKYVTAIGMNVDCGHGVVEKELIERLDYLKENKIILHEEILSKSQEKTSFYMKILNNCSIDKTIVHSFILSALNNEYGYVIPHKLKHRIKANTTVNVSELTKKIIICDAEKLSQTIVYFDSITNTVTSDELDVMLCDL